MTPEQFIRWKSFATRMAKHGWPDATEARKVQIAMAVKDFIDRYRTDFGGIDNWDGGGPGSIYLCDDLSSWLWDHYHSREDGEQTRFEMQVSCCVRAGFDQAVYPSAGVVGFTVGTLRRMYDGEIPEWVTDGFEPPITKDTPDDAGVWL